MRDTVWSIVFTQVPIAVACLWVAWELRGAHRALRDIAGHLERLSKRKER
jgi:hypothetical protein